MAEPHPRVYPALVRCSHGAQAGIHLHLAVMIPPRAGGHPPHRKRRNQSLRGAKCRINRIPQQIKASLPHPDFVSVRNDRNGGLLMGHRRTITVAREPATAPTLKTKLYFFDLIDCSQFFISSAAISRPPIPTARATATARVPTIKPKTILIISLARPI